MHQEGAWLVTVTFESQGCGRRKLLHIPPQGSSLGELLFVLSSPVLEPYSWRILLNRLSLLMQLLKEAYVAAGKI